MTTTHVLAVIDASGSMHDLADDVRGGFTEYIDTLQTKAVADDHQFRVTVTTFNTEMMPLCTAAELRDVPALDRTNYRPGGNTALIDAVATTVLRFEAATQLADDDLVQLVIMTDGHENASREHTWQSMKAMLDEREAGGKWSIVYIGQGAPAWDKGHLFSTGTHNVNADRSKFSTHATYGAAAAATVDYAQSRDPGRSGDIIRNTPGVTGDANA